MPTTPTPPRTSTPYPRSPHSFRTHSLRTNRGRRWAARASTVLTLALLAALSWLRADRPVDDRGSDSSEKAFMVILAITTGTAVSAAAVAFVATKTALFK
jgi:hypothetical protein